MIVTFDGLTLTEPEVRPVIRPQVQEKDLVSGETKTTVSSKTKKNWKISCLTESPAEYAALLAKVGLKGSLVIDGTPHTNCSIKSWDEDEINPTTNRVKMTFTRDTT